jgi:hypothetical protein
VYSDQTLRAEGGCLDVVGAGTSSGTAVDWYPCNGTVAQTWDHKSSGELVNPNSGLCLTDPGNTTGSALDVATCTGATGQHWTLPTGAAAGSSAPEFSLAQPGGGDGYGGFPSSFWGKTSTIPSAPGAIEFDFINATKGKYASKNVYWDVNGVEKSIAQSRYYTMSSCTACRINFYLGSPNSRYHDFIELNSSGTTINADTSRVDAFGLPLVVHLHNSDGTNTVVGEDYQVFSESRSSLFRQFKDSVPAPFRQLATVNAPYSIPAPGDVAAFQPGGADANYMVPYAASVGATETTQQVFGCSGGGSPDLSGDPTLCAGLNRCVAQFPPAVQSTPADYYKHPPCDYYSRFWHSVAVHHLQYGFAYDDVDGQSSDFSSGDAKYVQVAIGW